MPAARCLLPRQVSLLTPVRVSTHRNTLWCVKTHATAQKSSIGPGACLHAPEYFMDTHHGVRIRFNVLVIYRSSCGHTGRASLRQFFPDQPIRVKSQQFSQTIPEHRPGWFFCSRCMSSRTGIFVVCGDTHHGLKEFAWPWCVSPRTGMLCGV